MAIGAFPQASTGSSISIGKSIVRRSGVDCICFALGDVLPSKSGRVAKSVRALFESKTGLQADIYLFRLSTKL